MNNRTLRGYNKLTATSPPRSICNPWPRVRGEAPPLGRKPQCSVTACGVPARGRPAYGPKKRWHNQNGITPIQPSVPSFFVDDNPLPLRYPVPNREGSSWTEKIGPS